MPTSIQHTVAFTLPYATGSAEESDFLAAARGLADVPGVQDFRQLRQVSPKSGYRLMLSMRFDDEAAYQGYNEHPVHRAFVRDRWEREVTDFQELDLVALDQD